MIQQSSENPQDEIVNLEKSFALAIQTQEPAQAEKFLSDTYFLAIGVQGMPFQIVSKEHWLSGLKDYVTDSFSFDDIKVNIYGNTAIALLLYSQKAIVRGHDRSGQFIITDVWIKGDKGWLISERHSSRPEAPAITRPE